MIFTLSTRLAKVPHRKEGKMKKFIKILVIVIAAIVVILGAYVAYVFISFHRIEDDQELAVQNIAAGAMYGDEIAGEVQEAFPLEKELTMTSYNVGFGAYSADFTFFMDGGKESWAFSKEAVYENLDGAIGLLNEKDSDIAVLQEVDINGTRSYHIDEREVIVPGIAKTAAYDYTFAQNYDSPFLMYPLTQPHGANQAGILTFSKYRLTSGLRKSLPIEEGLSKVLDLDRCYSKSRAPVENEKELVIYNLHLSAYTSDPTTAETQLSLLVKDMQAEYDAGNYCVAGGDFNRDLLGNSPEIFHTAVLADNWAKPINMDLFTKDITLVAPFDESAPAASCRNPDKPYEEGDFVVTVDGFIKSANVEVKESKVIDSNYAFSDHDPVYMIFKLKK